MVGRSPCFWNSLTNPYTIKTHKYNTKARNWHWHLPLVLQSRSAQVVRCFKPSQTKQLQTKSSPSIPANININYTKKTPPRIQESAKFAKLLVALRTFTGTLLLLPELRRSCTSWRWKGSSSESVIWRVQWGMRMHIKCILHKLNNINSKASTTKDMNANIHLPYHRTPWSLPLVSELTLSSQWPLHTNTVQCSKRLNPRSDKLGVWCPSLLDQKKIIFAALWYIQTMESWIKRTIPLILLFQKKVTLVEIHIEI